MGWALIFEFFPEQKEGGKSKNIKAQPDFFLNIFTQELFNRIYVGKYTINMFFMLTSISLF
jgi:hypothetical protein